jgi:hypothetical protein
LKWDRYGQGHGGLSQNRKRRVIGRDHADKGQRRRAARFHRHFHAEYSLASCPAALRPPHPWPKARHRGVAPSLFCFERDPHALYWSPFQKAKVLPSMELSCNQAAIITHWDVLPSIFKKNGLSNRTCLKNWVSRTARKDRIHSQSKRSSVPSLTVT